MIQNLQKTLKKPFKNPSTAINEQEINHHILPAHRSYFTFDDLRICCNFITTYSNYWFLWVNKGTYSFKSFKNRYFTKTCRNEKVEEDQKQLCLTLQDLGMEEL
jgi:hypothetical protein